MNRNIKLLTLLLSLPLVLWSCGGNSDKTKEQSSTDSTKNVSIISLNGTITEILVALGMEQNITGVDITSTYPESVKSKTQVGHTHNLDVESVIALKPDYVLSLQERGVKPEQAAQLQQAGIKVWVINQEGGIEGTKNLINTIADSFHKHDEATKLIDQIDASLASLPKYVDSPKVLFIYARGAGTLQVSGKGTPMAKIIELAGGKNAGSDFEDFKPLTAEALVKMNPDAILLFESGLKSLDGPEGLLKAPGVAQTNAGKNKRFIQMDGQLLSGFGPRVADAVKELGAAIHQTK